MSVDVEAAAPPLARVLLIGGFGIVGAAAGVRFAIGILVERLECGLAPSAVALTQCQQLVSHLESKMVLLLVGGVVAMLAGGVALHQLKSESS